MVTKAAKEFTDSMGHRKIKGNMDVELAVDAMRVVDVVDHIVLFTGDGDFRALVAALQLKGKRVSAVSSLRTQPALASDELRRQVDQFVELADLEPFFSRKAPQQPVDREAVVAFAAPAEKRSSSIARARQKTTAATVPHGSARDLGFPDEQES
jgi:uncharacterized LabA/DUF88 family protein